MIRLYALDEPLADIDLVDGKMVFSNFLNKIVEKNVPEELEFCATVAQIMSFTTRFRTFSTVKCGPSM